MKTVFPFDCDVPGTVSATYGTLIVLAISFAIAATGIFLSLLNGIFYTDSIPGALLYYGLLSMRERRYGSSQYYPRYWFHDYAESNGFSEAHHNQCLLPNTAWCIVSFSSPIRTSSEGTE